MENKSFFKTPKGEAIIEKAKKLFSDTKIYVKKDSKLIFVCGAEQKEGIVSYRDSFIKQFYTFNFQSKLAYVLAEDALKEFNQTEASPNYNLSIFEHLIANTAFCILLFLESDGAKAELGFFSAIKELCSKLLVVNNSDFRYSKGFIRFGPLDIINRINRSIFGEVIYIDPINAENKDTFNFQPVIDCINSQITAQERERRIRFDYASAMKKKRNEDTTGEDYPLNAINLFTVLEIINLFYFIKWQDKRIIFGEIFNNLRIDDDELALMISILKSAGFIRVELDNNHQDYYILSNQRTTSYFELSRDHKNDTFKEFSDLTSYQMLKAEIAENHGRNNPKIFQQWSESQ